MYEGRNCGKLTSPWKGPFVVIQRIDDVTYKIQRRPRTNPFVLNDRIVTNNQEIAESFNDFFVNIGPNLANKILTENKKPYTSYLKKIITSTFYFNPINQDDLLKILHSLRTKPSAGHDGISVKLLKNLAPALIKPLTLIINQSLVSGIFSR